MVQLAPRTILAYSYLRFSTPAQADGDSTRRQTELRDDWLERHPDVRLDSALVDAGVRGYTGEHRTNKKHALARFLDLVERGRVPVGSYLICENLDRLTREAPEVAIPLVMNLIGAGVRVVQLAPVEMVYEPGMDFGRLMSMLWELARGHGESKRKSQLCGAAWTAKKKKAREERVAYGKNAPAWLELVGDRYKVRPTAAAAVRKIFKLSAQGLGSLAITRRLTAEGVEPIARGERWIRSYVAKILDNRAVLGEYQPMKGHHGRTPDGDPVPRYFPAVVSQALWDKAHGARRGRSVVDGVIAAGPRRGQPRYVARAGRPVRNSAGKTVSLFAGLLRCALDSCPMHVITRKGRRSIVSARAVNGEAGAHWRPFPLETFNDALLSELREVKAAQVFDDPGAGKVARIEGKIGEVEKKLARARERFDADPESPTWADLVSRYDRELRDLARERAEAVREASCPLSASWAEAVALMAKKDPERLRQALLVTIETVHVVIAPRLNTVRQLCFVQVNFVGGARRIYRIQYFPHDGTRHSTSFPSDPGEGGLRWHLWKTRGKDLGDPACVADLLEHVRETGG